MLLPFFRPIKGSINFQRNFGITSVAASSSATNIVENISNDRLPLIPDVPAAPVQEIVNAVSASGEPTFASLGLGGDYWPVSLLQNSLEFIHVTCGLPWWGTIALATVIIRACLTPIVVISQRNAAIMRNMMPEMQEIQLKISEARQMGNPIEMAQQNQELMMLMKTKGMNPIKNMLLPMAQAPIFISFFVGIRRMVNCPVESLQTGGILWFKDLTVMDPYYLLPLITCSTLALTIRLGTDGARMGTGQNPELVNYILNGLPIVIFPFIMKFPAAMVVYWASSNLCSLAQVKKFQTNIKTLSLITFLQFIFQGMLFKIPAVRKFFNIPLIIKHDPSVIPNKPKGFVKNVKNGNF